MAAVTKYSSVYSNGDRYFYLLRQKTKFQESAKTMKEVGISKCAY